MATELSVKFHSKYQAIFLLFLDAVEQEFSTEETSTEGTEKVGAGRRGNSHNYV